MPYSVAWNEAIPAGTSSANQIHTFITNDKIAVRERLDDIFGTSGSTGLATADPYRPALIRLNGAVTSKIIPGTTSLELRNNADGAANVTVLDSGNTDVRGTLKVNKRAAGVVSALTSAATVNIDLELANLYTLTLGHNVTFTFSNPTAGHFFTIQLTQDGTGSRTVTWPASVEWAAGTAPVITTTAGRTDVISLVYNGSKYVAVLVGQNFDLT